MGAPGATFPPRSTSYGRRGRQADALRLDHRSAPRAYPLRAADGAGPSGEQARSSQPPVPSTIWIRRSGRCWAMGHAKKLTQKPVWSRTPTLRTYEQQVGASRGYTKPRRLSRCLITVVGRKLLRGCRWVGYQKKRDCLRQLSVRLPRRRRAPGRIQRVHAIWWKRA